MVKEGRERREKREGAKAFSQLWPGEEWPRRRSKLTFHEVELIKRNPVFIQDEAGAVDEG